MSTYVQGCGLHGPPRAGVVLSPGAPRAPGLLSAEEKRSATWQRGKADQLGPSPLALEKVLRVLLGLGPCGVAC